MTLFAVCFMHAADQKSGSSSRVMSLVDIETDDPQGYAVWIKQWNAAAKAKFGVEPYLRVYETWFDGTRSGKIRVSSSAPTYAELQKMNAALEADPAVIAVRGHLSHVRKQGARTLYQSVRYEQNHAKQYNWFGTYVIPDETAFLQVFNELRGIYDNNGFKDIKLNFWRVIAGRRDHSHRIVVGAPSAERLAAMIDFGATHPQMLAYFAKTANLRTVVENGTVREITR